MLLGLLCASSGVVVPGIGVRIAIRGGAPKRFEWTKTADMILEKINRCKEALGTQH